MPYIQEHSKDSIDIPDVSFKTVGELNYLISSIIGDWIKAKGGLGYDSINSAIGVLECAKLELYRRIAAPYEDLKIDLNGDIGAYKQFNLDSQGK